MSRHAEHYAFRGELKDRLRRDLLGPVGGENEVIGDDPVTAYPVGVLFPQRAADEDEQETIAARDDEAEDAAAGRDEDVDSGVSLANVKAPSAMGITFAVSPFLASTITLRVTAAVYESVDADGVPVRAERAEWRTTSERQVFWRRRPLEARTFEVDLTAGEKAPEFVDSGLELRVLIRPSGRGETALAVTATLVNVNRVAKGELSDPYCYFQTRIEATGPEGREVFVERTVPVGADDAEVKTNRLLYRHVPTFAVGHGCAADWDWEAPPPGDALLLGAKPAAVAAVRTAHVPSAEVLLMDSNPDIDASDLGMLRLAEAQDEAVIAGLRALVRAYREWIAQRSEEARLLEGNADLSDAADERIKACLQACDRMSAGVDLLRDDPDVMTAFRRANWAMAEQRARAAWIKRGRQGEVDPGSQYWRPFQIAFMLLCLRGIVDDEHEDRGIADLLWFPTGGGKTEAYLGLIAFTAFLRRKRRGAKGGGVTALMRYTLRLLTLQQFQRAAALICAMERIRSKNPAELGEEPVSLGMWIGGSSTPNTLKRAARSLKEKRNGKELQEQDPVQLRACPWCGTEMDAFDYEVEADLTRMRIRCPSADCEFRRGLPVHVVDDEIYRVRPTLIIATVDKFAQIAWRPQVAALFNRDKDDGVPPPELIVQDELHLISGPLGSLTGLYETAVDIASDRPKVIASTATIRRAREQGEALFDRKVHQFPPQGLDARDSWFAVETPAEDKASREYVGLLAPNTSQATLLVRVYAALLHHARVIEAGDGARDPYWTLLGYFNSLRLLAAADLQVNDDVQDRLRQLAERDGSEPREVEIPTELTSRVKASDIPERLRQLDRRFPDPDAIDTLLATNMISVGVDIDRLGLMAVMGQPQTTAEYIQATSRVGRGHPGLVAVLFNAARSRDRSHHESFASYHAALYRQVESSSVTPFSARARDRGLHAVLVGLARLLHPGLRMNADAARIGEFEKEMEEIVDLILLRVKGTAQEEYEETEEDLHYVLDEWREMAEEDPDLLYEAPPRRHGHRENGSALLRTHSDEDLPDAFSTLWSLRDVDVESDLYRER